MTQTLPRAADEKINWVSSLPFLLFHAVPLLAFVTGVTWRSVAIFVVLYAVRMFAVTAGYHRYFSHKSYECAPVVQVLFAVFGAMAAQGSILAWASGHRRHHRHTDEDWDPHNIKRGFWWSHMLWIFEKYDADYGNVPDLQRNPIVRWQERWCRPLLLGAGFALPAGVGALHGDVWAGLLWGGFLRIVVCHHTAFLVNSASHSFGRQTFDRTVSARDNWLVALLTLGEGYHSFHHRFPGDYRNGVRWYQWDPAKWLIAVLRGLGLARRLKRIPDEKIEGAEMTSAVHGFERRLERAPAALAAEVRAKLEAARMAAAVEAMKARDVAGRSGGGAPRTSG